MSGKIFFNKVTTLSNKIRCFSNLLNLLSGMSTCRYGYN